jgi:hypothetical protein
MIGKVCDTHNRLRRGEPENVSAEWVDAPAGAKLQQRAVDGRRLAPPRQTPQSHALEQAWHPSPLMCVGRCSAFTPQAICRRS